MRPFGWLPSLPKWEFKSKKHESTVSEERPIHLDAASVVQFVSPDWVAVFNRDSIKEDVDSLPDLDTITPNNPSTWDTGLDIDAIWPASSAKVALDMDPSLPPSYLVDRYKEISLGNGPLALFPKQILVKARMGMETETYICVLADLLLTPEEIDAKYALSEHETPMMIEARKAVGGQRPLSTILTELRIRDTQLQLLICLELLSMRKQLHVSVTPKAKPETVSLILDSHFDRLCIWQAVAGSDMLDELCSTAVVPYFQTRAHKKTKQLMRISQGTFQTRDKNAGKVKKLDSPLSTAQSGIGAGLLKALQMQNLIAEQHKPVETSSNNNKSSGNEPTRVGSSRAKRSVSHPVYRRQAHPSQVEVRFKKPKHTPSRTPSRTHTPEAVPPPLPVVPAAPTPTVPALPARNSPPPPPLPPQGDFIEATPTKTKTSYLESLPQQTTLFANDDDDNEIGSTDSDD